MDMTAAYAAFAMRHDRKTIPARQLQNGDRILDDRERSYPKGDFGRVLSNVRRDGDLIRFTHTLNKDPREGHAKRDVLVTVLRPRPRRYVKNPR